MNEDAEILRAIRSGPLTVAEIAAKLGAAGDRATEQRIRRSLSRLREIVVGLDWYITETTDQPTGPGGVPTRYHATPR